MGVCLCVLLPTLVFVLWPLGRQAHMRDIFVDPTGEQSRLLGRYLELESQRARGVVSEREWRRKQKFLADLYVDLARQVDRASHSALLVLLSLGLVASGAWSHPLRAEATKSRTEQAEPAEASLSTANHIVILQANQTELSGMYFFGLFNRTSSEQEFSGVITLPNEATDFGPGMNLDESHMQLASDGTLTVRRVAPPGLTIAGVSFTVPIEGRRELDLSFDFRGELEQFHVAAPVNAELSLSAEELRPGIPRMLPAEAYRGVQGGPFARGRRLRVSVSGLPNDQTYILGGVLGFGILLLGLGAYLTLRGRNRRLGHKQAA